MSPNRWDKKKLKTITIADFINKGIELNFFNEKNAEDLRNRSKQTSKFPLFLSSLISNWIITENNASQIIKDLFKPYYNILQVKKEKNTYKSFHSYQKWTIIKNFSRTQNIHKDLSFAYKESIDKYHFSDKKINIVLFDVDHNTQKLHVFIPYPDEYIFSQIQKFKKESTILKDEQTFYFEDNEWNTVTETRKLFDYWFVLHISDISVNRYIHNYNIDASKSTNNQLDKMDEKLKQAGIWTWEKEENIINLTNASIDNEWSFAWMLENIIKKSDEMNASDIHFEPLIDSIEFSDAWFVRFRRDGDLTSRKWPSGELSPTIRSKYKWFIAYMKEKSNMKSSVTNKPQDGKLKLILDNTIFEYRVSSLNEWEIIENQAAEKIVMRRLSRDTSYLNLRNLNMDEEFKGIIDDIIWDPKENNWKRWRFNNWLVLMTGPTGSGKSTTLFSILNQINIEEVNIQTLEDPIEYVLPWINQSQVSDSTTNNTESEAYTYHKGMKACLRQDPDIILVWEIRDEITMEVAKDAAATWHLVLSSLHTNDTWSTLDRLQNLWFWMESVWTVIRIIMAQRLWKLVCPSCCREYNDPIFSKWNVELQNKIDDEYNNLKMNIVKKLLDSPYVEELPDDISEIKLYRWHGENCAKCKWKKTHWRSWIYEFLPITIWVENFIAEHWIGASKEKIKDLFSDENLVTLYQNALVKTFRPIKDKSTWDRYMSYHDAVSNAGADNYDWWVKYEKFSYEELSSTLKDKKIKRKIKKLEKELSIIDNQIKSERKTINPINKDIKEKLIKELEIKEIDLLDKKEEYKEILSSKKNWKIQDRKGI